MDPAERHLGEELLIIKCKNLAIKNYWEALVPLCQKFKVSSREIANKLSVKVEDIVHQIVANNGSLLNFVDHGLYDQRKPKLLN